MRSDSEVQLDSSANRIGDVGACALVDLTSNIASNGDIAVSSLVIKPSRSYFEVQSDGSANRISDAGFHCGVNLARIRQSRLDSSLACR